MATAFIPSSASPPEEPSPGSGVTPHASAHALAPAFVEPPLREVCREVLARFLAGATPAGEDPRLARLAADLRAAAPRALVEEHLRDLAERGHLRSALVLVAEALLRSVRPDLAFVLGRELLDALDRALGQRLLAAVVSLPEVVEDRFRHDGVYAAAHLLLGEQALREGDAKAAAARFEAVFAVEVDHPGARAGYAAARRLLARAGAHLGGAAAVLPSGRFWMVDGLEDLDLLGQAGLDRYELRRPIGRGRHAVVYEAFDRAVGRDVALKRLLTHTHAGTGRRVHDDRFFAEAEALARVRSPYVIAILDVRREHRFIALDLCRGGSLRQALRRGALGPSDLTRIGTELLTALRAVHGVGATHRDVKPANILLRTTDPLSPIALGDFGLATRTDLKGPVEMAGTLRYLAPELRRPHAVASAASDLFSAGVVLLEISRSPASLPPDLDFVDHRLDLRRFVPPDLPDAWSDRLTSLLHPDETQRTW